jgi:hypothetical protein
MLLLSKTVTIKQHSSAPPDANCSLIRHILYFFESKAKSLISKTNITIHADFISGEYSRFHNSLKEGLLNLGHEVIIGDNDFKNYPLDISVFANIQDKLLSQ